MGRFYWPDEDSDPEACYDKQHDVIWILGQFSSYERKDDWNHWEIFARPGLKVECVGVYWWWGVWDPEPNPPDIEWDPYWRGENIMSREHRVHVLYLEAKELGPTRYTVRSYA